MIWSFLSFWSRHHINYNLNIRKPYKAIQLHEELPSVL